MKIGSAEAIPGETDDGWLDVTHLPTGPTEQIPVSITCGEKDGPTLWVTGALHGNEVTGIAAAQDFITDEIRDDLRGTVVSIPVLNPAGLRLNDRYSYYNHEDPNRLFPYGVDDRQSPPSVQELINDRVFERLAESADALVSLHEGWINEALYTIVERVRYGTDRSRAEAEHLADRTVELAEAFGLPRVREYDVEIQEAYGLERSFECAAINAAGVPTITPELGSPHVIEEDHRRAAVTGLRNVLRNLEMLPGEPVPNEDAPESPVEYPVKRVDGPVAQEPGIVRHRVDTGAVLDVGEPIADIVTPHGTVKQTVESATEGYILGRREGVAVYENDILVSMAARDEGSLLVDQS